MRRFREFQARWSILLSGVALFVLGFALPAAAQDYYIVDTGAPTLLQVDPTTGGVLDTQTITLPGETVEGATALTAHPTTEELWAILNIDGSGAGSVPGPRPLVTIDPTTGVATSIGDTGLPFASLSFDDTGTLYGVTGDQQGSTTPMNPESLFTLDQTDATPTLVTALGNGDDGEAIAFNFDDGLMYHASGRVPLNDPVDGKIFESINLDTLTITNIPLTSFTDEEISGLVYDGSDTFLAVDIDEILSTLTTDGVQTELATVDAFPEASAFRGIARIPAAVPVSPE